MKTYVNSKHESISEYAEKILNTINAKDDDNDTASYFSESEIKLIRTLKNADTEKPYECDVIN